MATISTPSRPEQQQPLLVAVLPINQSLDEEAEAAAAVGLPVVRFKFLDHLEIILDDTMTAGMTHDKSDSDKSMLQQRRGLHRGFMLSEPRYQQLYTEFKELHGITLITSPAEYAKAHYYPNAYPYIKDFSPRSCWCEVPNASSSADYDQTTTRSSTSVPLTKELFEDAVATVEAWEGVTHVMLKDYVKSAKPHFLKEPVAPRKVWINMKNVGGDDDGQTDANSYSAKMHTLCDSAMELVAERGINFNRGVVFKEYIQLGNPRNEWRAWFVKGELLSVNFNSQDVSSSRMMDRVPTALLERATAAAKAIGSPFITIDFAFGAVPVSCGNLHEYGGWFCLEAGDGGVSGPAVEQDLEDLWRGLLDAFTETNC